MAGAHASPASLQTGRIQLNFQVFKEILMAQLLTELVGIKVINGRLKPLFAGTLFIAG